MAVTQRRQEGYGGYICFSNVHTVVTSRTDRDLREYTNRSFLSLPDGRPLSIYARLCGYKDVDQVAGPDFMEYCLQAMPGTRHFFYGSTEKTLTKLCSNIRERYPQIQIVGAYSPPFRDLTEHEKAEVIRMINDTNPDFVWVGLGAPKQEKWMAENWQHLKPAILLGVGAAFDFHAGTVKRCPQWMRTMSLEWLYRLIQEPRRLWRRYFVTNSLFIWFISVEALFKMMNRDGRTL